MEIYISTDLEADGPIPGPHSMLALGASAFSITRDEGVKLLSSFSVNLQELEGATQDPATMEFWSKHHRAWEINRRYPVSPAVAMNRYLEWLERDLDGEPVFVAWPATFDFLFVYWYLMKFVGRSPFEWSGLDAKSYAMAIKRKRWLEVSMDDLGENVHVSPNSWPHVAVYDAKSQGWRICQMIHDNMFGTTKK